jgi:hypothetical protein
LIGQSVPAPRFNGETRKKTAVTGPEAQRKEGETNLLIVGDNIIERKQKINENLSGEQLEMTAETSKSSAATQMLTV